MIESAIIQFRSVLVTEGNIRHGRWRVRESVARSLRAWEVTPTLRSEREGAALAVVSGRGRDASFGRRRRLLDIPVLAAVPGEHVWRAPSSTPIPETDARTRSSHKPDPAVKAAMRACEARMDGDISEQAPWTSELLVLAMALPG